MISVAVIGATGYTGMELVRILTVHPQVRVVAVTSEKFSGKAYSEIVPSVEALSELRLEPFNPDKVTRRAQLVFSCLPHKEAMAAVPLLLARHVKVIDLSADFRFDSVLTYQQWYTTHTAPDLLKTKVYGLPELHRAEIREADLVGNPGCYPTSIILGLAPLLKAGLVLPEGIICDSKSGVTGAGRKVELDYLYSEVNEGIRAYGVGSHRHRPEAEQELSRAAGKPVQIIFTPHLVPMDRGILSTLYARPVRKETEEDYRQALKHFYRDHPFVKVMKAGVQPNTKQVRGTNYCHIGVALDAPSGQLIVTSAIDNLVKGAAGQAVQNMNLMCKFEETAGLKHSALIP